MIDSNKSNQEKEQISLKQIEGIFWDEVYTQDKNGKDILITRTEKKKNKILIGMAKVIAGLLANEATFLGGILYSAQGAGDVGWDAGGPPAPVWTQIKLVDELFRKVPDSIAYVDVDGNPVGYISNYLLVKTILEYAETALNDKYIREQGLFGGDATITKDSGYLLDTLRHLKIWKDASIKIIRYIQLGFVE